MASTSAGARHHPWVKHPDLTVALIVPEQSHQRLQCLLFGLVHVDAERAVGKRTTGQDLDGDDHATGWVRM
jgi:hypothetical protein